MVHPIKVMDIELNNPPKDLEGLEKYRAVKLLVRLHGTPLGYVTMPQSNGLCKASEYLKVILDQQSWNIMRILVQNGLSKPVSPNGLRLEDLLNLPPSEYTGPLPSVTVAVCTRNRVESLAICLDSLNCLEYCDLDILIVDNAPSDNTTKNLVRTRYSNMRYVREPRPGLNWARNRAILEARGEIIAYTDDDVIVDAGWIRTLAEVFAENLEVMGVTGLVVPYELETQAQILFEEYGGFGCGFERKWLRAEPETGERAASHYSWCSEFGTGANMAYRVSLFDRIGCFDPALDVGTVTNGAGDMEIFFRMIQEGYTLVYEPRAIVRHRHRREYAELYSQITNNGIGFSAYYMRNILNYPRDSIAFIWVWLKWLRWWGLHRLIGSYRGRESYPRKLIWAEIKGGFIGLTRYPKAKRNAAAIAREFGPMKKITKKSRSSVNTNGTPYQTDRYRVK